MGKGWNSLDDIRILDDINHARDSLISNDCIPAFVFPSHIDSHCNFCNCQSQIRWSKLYSELYGWGHRRWIQTQVVCANHKSSCRKYWDISTGVSNPCAALQNLDLLLNNATIRICRQCIRKAQRSAGNFVVCSQACSASRVPLYRNHSIFTFFQDFNRKIFGCCLRVN